MSSSTQPVSGEYLAQLEKQFANFKLKPQILEKETLCLL